MTYILSHLHRTLCPSASARHPKTAPPKFVTHIKTSGQACNVFQEAEEERKRATREAARDKAAALEKLTTDLRAEKLRELDTLRDRLNRKYTTDTGHAVINLSDGFTNCLDALKQELSEVKSELDKVKRALQDGSSFGLSSLFL